MKTIWEDDQRVQTVPLLHSRLVNFQVLKKMYFLLMLSSAWLKELVFVSHKAFLVQKENRSGEFQPLLRAFSFCRADVRFQERADWQLCVSWVQEVRVLHIFTCLSAGQPFVYSSQSKFSLGPQFHANGTQDFANAMLMKLLLWCCGHSWAFFL